MIRAKAVKDGTETFDQFARRTSRDWDRLAAYLHRRWKVPAAVEVDDVKAEMLVAAWRAIGKYAPGRGRMTIDSYVIWVAITSAKRWLHMQRKAKNKSCREESRHAISFSEIGWHEDRRYHEAGQEMLVERELELSRLVLRCDERERILLTAVWHIGSARHAGKAVYEDPELRSACGLRTRREASLRAARVVEKIAELYSGERI